MVSRDLSRLNVNEVLDSLSTRTGSVSSSASFIDISSYVNTADYR